ncbi:MAG: serine hydrolase domain-containing protein [Novosphingobium sp.]
MKRFVTALVALALPLQPLLAAAPALQPAEETAIDAAVTKSLKETGIPSVEVAVVRDGQIVLSRAWGKPSETLTKPDAALPYQIASNSKQFLAALLLLLEDDGKISLDDPVSKWLPDLPNGDRIRVRQLLSHTSGLQDFWPQDYSFAAMEKPVAPMDIVRRWGFKPLDYAPGSRWQYSNTGYVVAGLIAEKAGGAPLWDQLEARIFKPLGIHPYDIDETNGPQFPQGYHRNALGPVRVARPPAKGWLWAAGGLSMTAAELAKWDIARINRTLLTKDDWEEMERPVRLADGTWTTYGLGVSKHLTGGRWVIDHGGESVGFLSQNSIWVDDRTAVVVLTNGDFAQVQEELTSKIAEIVLPKAVQANIGEKDRLADVKTTLVGITAGKLNPAQFTDNGRYYFNPQVLGDYSASLRPLGPLKSVTTVRPPRLRGGFVNRVFKLNYAKKSLTLITYAEPGEHGRWEQFMITP